MTNCDSCGIDMYDKDSKFGDIIGLSISINDTTKIYEITNNLEIKNKKSHKEIERVEKMFGKTNFNICFPCMIKTFNIKFKVSQ